MAQITKELAKKILKKLKAERIGSGAHLDYQILDFHGRIVAMTSLRHGSSKNLGHDHMPDDLHIGPGKAKLLGQCPLGRTQYIEILQEQGDADPDPDPEPDEAE
jgi:hypothetical protein